MKTILTLILSLSLFIFSQAQSDGSSEASGSAWGGVAGSLSKFVDKFEMSKEAKEALRWMSIYNSDIRMWMQSVPGSSYELPIKPPFGPQSYSADGSIYAEFDWDNLAEKMIIDSKGDPATGGGAVRYTTYTDKHANIYFPYENTYIKMNPKNAILQNTPRILGIAFALDELAQLNRDNLMTLAQLMGLIRNSNNPIWIRVLNSYNTIVPFLDGRGPAIAAVLIRQLLDERYTSIVGFPVFIHWALMYSPDLLKSKFSVTESTVDCPDGSGPNCTKCTVSSGSEKGKSMTFDQYGRLVYIDAKKEGSVRYAYDRDLTVNVPQAITFDQLLRAARLGR